MRVLVTGAAGFIGRSLLQALVERDSEAVGVVRTMPEDPVPGARYVVADLTDPTGLKKVLEPLAVIDVCVHLAAKIPSAHDEPLDAFSAANCETTNNLLSLLSPQTRFVYGSTIDVYGPPQTAEHGEDHPCNPETAYGVSKRMAELLVEASEHPFVILRFSQVYGPGEKLVKVIPRFIERITHQQPLTLVTGGADRRRYLWITDAVDACVIAAMSTREGTFNIAGPDSVTMREVVHTFEAVLGRTLAITEVAGTPSGDRVMNIGKAERDLGFTPRTSFHEGIRAYCVHAGLI